MTQSLKTLHDYAGDIHRFCVVNKLKAVRWYIVGSFSVRENRLVHDTITKVYYNSFQLFDWII